MRKSYEKAVREVVTMAMVAGMLTGCAPTTVRPDASEMRAAPSSNVFPPKVTSANPVRLTIYREVGFQNRGQTYFVELDGQRLANLQPAEYASFEVDPGIHQFVTGRPILFNRDMKMLPVEATWTPGQEVTYRLGTDEATFYIIRDPEGMPLK